jgi:hypothetical protein
MRHSHPSTNSRYKLSTKFSYAHSTNFRYGIAASLGYGPSIPHSTTTYQSNSGKVSSLNAVTAALQPAGSFASPDSMGGACNYGECPAWQFTNDHFSYALPDSTTADFTNFSGTADFTNQSDVKVKGTASGNDSAGTPVQVTVDWAWSASCRSGRGGGCTKTFISGTLTVVK